MPTERLVTTVQRERSDLKSREQELAQIEKRINKLPFLDVLRGVAILSVFLFHSLGAACGYYSQPWKGLYPDFFASNTHWPFFPLTIGNCGVAIFFVVSGFCIHLSHSKGETWRAFIVKRFFRIYPPYLLALLVFYLSWPWRTYSLASPGWQHQFWSHFSLVHNLEPATAYGINGSFWSIAVETQLYLIYPLLFLIVVACGWRISLVILFGIETAVRMSLFPFITAFDSLALSPLGFWFSWALGAFAAHCYLDGSCKAVKSWHFNVVLLLAVVSYVFHPLAKFQFMIASLATALFIARQISSGTNSPIKLASPHPVARHLAFLGTISYSFYLLHQPILLMIQRLPARFHSFAGQPLWSLALALSLYIPILFISALSYKYVEMPSYKIGKKLIETRFVEV